MTLAVILTVLVLVGGVWWLWWFSALGFEHDIASPVDMVDVVDKNNVACIIHQCFLHHHICLG